MRGVLLRVRTGFTWLEGASTAREVSEAVSEAGYSGWGLADRNGLAGLPEYLGVCEAFGLEPLAGVELDGAEGWALVFPRGASGYRRVCRWVSARQLAGVDWGLVAAVRESGEEVVVISDVAAVVEGVVEARGGSGGVYVALPGGVEPSRLELARRVGARCVAAPAVWLARREHAGRRRLLRAIGGRTTLGRLEGGGRVGWVGRAWRARFEGEEGRAAWACTEEVAEACRFGGGAWGYGRLTFPRWEGGEPASSALRREAYRGARRRYRVGPGGVLPRRVAERLERELGLVDRLGFADYFMVVREIVAGVERTCGRGSAAASVIAYSLGITHVDPVRHDLWFERFLSPGRETPPDIDVDLPWDERDAVLARVFERYAGRAAFVGTHVRFGGKAALREVARCMGFSAGEVKELRSVGGRRWERIVAWAQTLEGLPRHVGTHPGGVVITPGAIVEHAPVQATPGGWPVLQWEKEGVEAAGLVKVDLLGNRSLAVIRDTLEAVRRSGEAPPSYSDLDPEGDPTCEGWLAEGKTVGCFYVESPAMRRLQQRSGRGDFEHVVIHTSIVRPAASAAIQEYVRRLQGGVWRPVHRGYERLLRGTLGLMVFQEDVARVAIGLAAFDEGEADRLRKVLARKAGGARLAELRARFVEGACAQGAEVAWVEEVWAEIEAFAGYSFCKAHSASYAMVAFKAVWLKARYPAAFMAAVLSNGGGYYTRMGYLGEARRLGLEVKLACVNASRWSWSGGGRVLRAGLRQVVGVSRDSAKAVVVERDRGGPYSSVAELLERVPGLGRGELEALACAGALDVLGAGSRARTHWAIAGACAARGSVEPLFEGSGGVEGRPLPEVSDDAAWVERREEDAYGLSLRAPPLTRYSAPEGVISATRLGARGGEQVCVWGWIVSRKPVRTRDAEPMAFVTLEDPEGLIEVVVFPRLYERVRGLLEGGGVVLVEGRVEVDRAAVSLVAETVVAWGGSEGRHA